MRTIIDSLKNKAGESWVEDLQHILWAYRTTSRRATTKTPFALTYGFEAKLPVEVLYPIQRVEEYEDESNKDLIRIEKIFSEESARQLKEEWSSTSERLEDFRMHAPSLATLMWVTMC